MIVDLDPDEARLLADAARAAGNHAARERAPWRDDLPPLRYHARTDVVPVDRLHSLADKLDLAIEQDLP